VRRSEVKNCYLCGETLTEPIDDDHVPPGMFFAAGRGVLRLHALATALRAATLSGLTIVAD
jgi:hypothetical protein